MWRVSTLPVSPEVTLIAPGVDGPNVVRRSCPPREKRWAQLQNRDASVAVVVIDDLRAAGRPPNGPRAVVGPDALDEVVHLAVVDTPAARRSGCSVLVAGQLDRRRGRAGPFALAVQSAPAALVFGLLVSRLSAAAELAAAASRSSPAGDRRPAGVRGAA